MVNLVFLPSPCNKILAKDCNGEDSCSEEVSNAAQRNVTFRSFVARKSLWETFVAINKRKVKVVFIAKS